MTVYADQPGRRVRQVLGDLGAVGWVVAWVAVGRAVHGAVLRLGEPGRVLADAGRSLEEGLRDGAAALGRTPLLGDELRAPFDAAGDAARGLAAAGADAQTAVGRAALLAGVAVAAWPILLGAGALARAPLALGAPGLRRCAGCWPATTASTCWRCARSPPPRCPASRRSAPTRRAAGGAATRHRPGPGGAHAARRRVLRDRRRGVDPDRRDGRGTRRTPRAPPRA